MHYVYSCLFDILNFFSHLQNKRSNCFSIGMSLVNNTSQNWGHLQHLYGTSYWSTVIFSGKMFYSA